MAQSFNIRYCLGKITDPPVFAFAVTSIATRESMSPVIKSARCVSAFGYWNTSHVIRPAVCSETVKYQHSNVFLIGYDAVRIPSTKKKCFTVGGGEYVMRAGVILSQGGRLFGCDALIFYSPI